VNLADLSKLSDRNVEMAVLGGILLNPEILASLPRLEQDDFAHGDTRALFTAMRNLEAAEKPIDLTLLGDELARADKLEAIGGYAFLGSAALCCTTPANTEHYAEVLRRHRLARDVVKAAREAIASAVDGESGVDVLDQLQGSLARIEAGDDDDRERTLGQLCREEWDNVAREAEARAAGKQVITGMPTGLSALDKSTGGIPFGLLTIVAARPGCGKTTFSMRLAHAAAEWGDDQPFVFSYEDGKRSFAQRAMAQLSGVPTSAIRSREFVNGHMPLLTQAAPRMMRRDEVIVRASGMTVEDLCRRVRAMRRKSCTTGKSTRGKLVVIDFVQRMPLPRIQGASTSDKLGEIANRLADLAASEEIAIVLCSQLNREIEKRDDKAPRLSDLRGSGELEAAGKLILGLNRDSTKDRGGFGVLELHVLKDFNGENNTKVEVCWHLATHTICNNTADLPWMRGR
jgi:replicative DNA helicase